MKLPAFPAADALLWFGGRRPSDLMPAGTILSTTHEASPPRCCCFMAGHDTRAPIIHARQIEAALAGPASIVEFDAAHQVLARHSSDQWRTAAQAFFQSLSAPEAVVASEQ